MKYILCSDDDFGLKGCYYAGLNKKYIDMFDIVPEITMAKQFINIEEANIKKDRLHKAGYNFYIVEVEENKNEI